MNPTAFSSPNAAVKPPIERKASPPMSKLHGLRRVAEKVRRRVKQATGKPDNSPWVLGPAVAKGERAYVDFIFALDYLSPNSPLVKLMHEAMAPYGVRMLLINVNNVEAVTAQVRAGWLKPFVFLDLCSSSDARFAELANVAVANGVYVIDDPRDLLPWTQKSPAQLKLEAAGIPVPATVILPKGSPDRELTADERAKVGDSVVVKPSAGFANRGVVVGVEPTLANLAKARDFDRNDDWLVQRKVSWSRHGDRPAYLRAYHLLGRRSLMWWSRENGMDRYELLTWADLAQYDLLPAVDIVDRIATLSGVDFFSSEIAITQGSGADRFVVIDYINDQCDMDPEPRPGTTPVPQPWVTWVCATVAEFTWRRMRGDLSPGPKTLTLF